MINVRAKAVLLLVTAVACSKRENAAGAPAVGNATVTSAAVAPTAAPPAAPTSAGMSIDERFASEATSRPPGPTVVRAEHAIERFSSLGAAMREQRQHLGAPFGARYCMGARTGEDLHLSVCEYESDERAMAGAQNSRTAFVHVENRTVDRNGATTLTLRIGKQTTADQALARRIVDAFAAMKASR